MAEETLFNQWTSVVADSRNDIVFEHKHKDYGAYAIRRNYNKTVFWALTISAASFLFAISVPAIIAWIKNIQEEKIVAVDITSQDLTAPPPVNPDEPPPPPPPPPPVMETVKFTPPIVEDEKVNDDPPPVQTEETPQISTETHEGDGDKNDIIIPETTGNGVVEPVVEAPLTIVEQMPTFPGGEGELMKYIQKNVQYPQVEKEAGISGTCYVTFVVEKNGSISDVKAENDPGYGTKDEAVRVITRGPKWKPAVQNGRNVIYRHRQAIVFVVSED